MNDSESLHPEAASSDRNEAHRNTGSDALEEHCEDGEPEPSKREIGGRKGPDPVRYGDWEKNGRCIDF